MPHVGEANAVRLAAGVGARRVWCTPPEGALSARLMPTKGALCASLPQTWSTGLAFNLLQAAESSVRIAVSPGRWMNPSWAVGTRCCERRRWTGESCIPVARPLRFDKSAGNEDDSAVQLLGNERASLCEGKGPSAKPEAQAASDVIGGPDAIAAGWVLVHAEPRKWGGVRRQSTLRVQSGMCRFESCASSACKFVQIFERYRTDTGASHEPMRILLSALTCCAWVVLRG